MRLFKRKQPEGSLCPRCSQMVSASGLTCPMCGWDLGDAYQGPVVTPRDQAAAAVGSTGSRDGETNFDRDVT